MKRSKLRQANSKRRKEVRISSGRAQDWILSVLNPIIAGLRREAEFLDCGTRWLPNLGHFEYVHPLTEYISEMYLDNLNDFLSKYPKVQRRFKKHDDILRDLEQAIAAAYGKLMGPSGEEFQRLMQKELANVEKGDANHEIQYFAAYVASGISKIGANISNSEVYNRATSARNEGERVIRNELRKINEAQHKLIAMAEDLQKELSKLREKIADDYGARIMPVE